MWALVVLSASPNCAPGAVGMRIITPALQTKAACLERSGQAGAGGGPGLTYVASDSSFVSSVARGYGSRPVLRVGGGGERLRLWEARSCEAVWDTRELVGIWPQQTLGWAYYEGH